MSNRWRDLFSLDPDRVWLNASHQGPLPDVAADAVAQMVAWKQRPHNLSTPEPFTNVPERLRESFARLLGAPADEIALANSASYGLHLFANGLGLRAGDEVIVAANDFPSDILPWMRLADHGVVVNRLQPAGQVLTADETATAINDRTRVVCLTWVHSLSGQVIDLDRIGELCRSHNVLFVINAAQGLGGLPLQVGQHPIDGLVAVGFKYLCGPYGTGLAWIGERMADRLQPSKLYWLSALTADDLAQPKLDLDNIDVPNRAARHDIFGTANFFNFAALTASVDLITEIGIPTIRAHNLALADRLVDGLNPAVYTVQPRSEPGSPVSSIVFVEPVNQSADVVFARLREAGVDVARRVGKLRFAPHFYNTSDDIDRALEVLASAG